jgi:uncharacterized NAD-dependent epimerase/dehydratase family protein
MLSAEAPVVLLLHGGLDNLSGKTGLAMLRYRPGPILAVIDPAHAGADLETVTGIARSVPVLASLREALPLRPASGAPPVAVVGLAPSGGRLPPALRADLLVALAAGWSAASGLHSRLGDDPELAASCRDGAWIWDLRQEPADLPVASGRAAALPCRRLLAVGTDMAVGKMSACLELLAAARRRGLDARFIGTGQAGLLISGQGVPLDAVRVDYAAGAVEQAVLAAAAPAGPAGSSRDLAGSRYAAGPVGPDTWLLVEGQGSLCHPGSTATLPLLRGSQPTDLLLVHRAGQTSIRNHVEVAIPPLHEVIDAVERLAALGRPAVAASAPTPAPRVRAIALNTAHLDEESARQALADTAASTGLPCSDPVRQGGEGLWQVLQGE